MVYCGALRRMPSICSLLTYETPNTITLTAMQLCRQTLQRRHCGKCSVIISVCTTRPCSAASKRALAVRATAAADKHYAVVGAGLAGLATAYHLLKQSIPGQAVHVTVVDAVGVGAGGSGAAAGLLHPFTPKGKLLWKAHEAMAAALQLLQAAEEAAAQSPELPNCIAWRTGMLRPASNAKQSHDYWKVHSQHQQQQQQQCECGADAAAAELALLQASIADASVAQQLLPGVALPAVAQAAAANAHEPHQQQQEVQPHQQRRRQGEQQQQKLGGWTAAAAAALHIPGGITLHPLHYMQALWAACELAAAARGDGSSVRFHIQQLSSLAELPQLLAGNVTNSKSMQKLDAVVVAAGAAVGSLAEFEGQLPLSLCQGYTLDMVPPTNRYQPTQQQLDSSQQGDASTSSSNGSSTLTAAAAAGQMHLQYRADSPSLLGSHYLASQGGQVLVVGATKQHDWTAQQALQELGRVIDPSLLNQHYNQHGQREQQPASAGDAGTLPAAAAAGAREAAEVSSAAAELLAGAAAAWPPVARWRVGGIRSGVRALPPRTQQGAVPLAGRWTSRKVQQQQQQQQLDSEAHNSPPVWLLVGLGARGLVYHAWLGQLLAQAVLSDSEQQLPQELLAWRDVQPASSAAAAHGDEQGKVVQA